MPLIACPDCRMEFSDSLSSCPKCYWSRNSSQDKGRLSSLFPVFLIGIVLLAFAFGCYLYLTYTDSFNLLLPEGDDINAKRSNWGALGDFFGGLLNPVLTFFSLVILAVTLWFNQVELSLSREELAETRKEVARSSDALSAQSDSLQLQNFESTFFHLLNLYHSSVESLNLFTDVKRKQTFLRLANGIKREVSHGEELAKLHGISEIRADLRNLNKQADNCNIQFKKVSSFGTHPDPQLMRTRGNLKKKLDLVVKQEKNRRHSLRNIDDKELLNKMAFQMICPEATSAPLEHYFSTIESLLKYVRGADVTDKAFYNELIRSQMSFDEIYFLFFAFINDEDMKTLCTEAKLFRKLTIDDFYYGENHMRHYDREAFGLTGDWS